MALANHTSDEEWEERLAQTRAEMNSLIKHNSIPAGGLGGNRISTGATGCVDTVTLATRLAEHLVGKAIEHDQNFCEYGAKGVGVRRHGTGATVPFM